MDHNSRIVNRLKDSCDACAAAKVRCTKDKPRCNRCEAIGMSCVYSVARRVGRPHISRKNSRLGADASASNGTKRPERVFRFVDQSVRFPASKSYQASPQSLYQTQDPTLSSDSDGGEIPNLRALPGVLGTDTNAPCYQDLFNTTGPAQQQSKESHNSGGDCLTIATDNLQRLGEIQEAFRQLQYHSNHLQLSTGTASLNDSLQTIKDTSESVYMLQLCPCSDNSQTLVLAAAVCMGLIDLFGALLSTAAPAASIHMAGVTSKSGGIQHNRITEELARLGRIVMQLIVRCQRFGAEGSSQSSLAELGEFLKARLHSLMQFAASKLV